MSDYSNAPRITAGRNIVVEKLPDGYRVSARPDSFDAYRGFFQVLPYPDYSVGNSNYQLQIVNGALPYEESVREPAGYVSVDRLHTVSEKKGGGIGSRRLRIPAPSRPNIVIPNGKNTVFLKVAAHAGGDAGRLKYPDGDGKTVFFSCDYLIAPEVPELKEGVIYFPLAEVISGESGYSLTQLNSGEPSGVIMKYYGSDTLDGSDSGSESESESESKSESDPESESETSADDPESSSTEDPDPSSDSGGDAPDPQLWYIVANCVRYICHESIGLENFSGTTKYYAAKGDKIGFDPEPEPPSVSSPIAEHYGVVMLEGPFEQFLDIPQERIDELNELHIGDTC